MVIKKKKKPTTPADSVSQGWCTDARSSDDCLLGFQGWKAGKVGLIMDHGPPPRTECF